MGVPGFFLWLVKNYKNKHFIIKKSSLNNEDDNIIINELNNIDYFLIDTNCMLHPVCFKVLADNPKIHDINKLQRKMFTACIEYLEKIIMIADPKKGVYIAIDGVAPIAKIKQQRSRRFKSVHDQELFNNIRKKHNKEIPFFWNNSCITPGTKFMKQLDSIITEWAKKYSKKHNIEIIYSSCYTPMEGEHKLLQFIYEKKEYDYNYVMYGLDADLIFLTLATNKNNIYLLREANQINKKTQGFNFVSLRIMRDAIYNSFIKTLKNEEEFSDENIMIDKERVIADFIFICYLMGNDFLPHLPSLDIYGNAIDTLILKYIEIYYDLREYIIDRNNNFSINYNFFFKLIRELSLIEEQTLVESTQIKKRFHKPKSSDPFDIEMAKIENVMFKVKDPVRLGYDGMDEFRERYYKHYFNVLPNEINCFANKMVSHYLRGLKWVSLYYFDTCPSWDYYYPYDYPPFITDIYNYLLNNNEKNIFTNINFQKGTPLKPYEQLLCVLPKQSSYLLPKCLRKIMLNLNSSVVHLYPTKFEIDLINKHKYWMGIPQLPQLEIDNVKYIYKKYSNKLNFEENSINNIKNILIFK
jgi:5'-3' exoribonuclease 2